MLLMCLDILPKLVFTVMVEIDGLASDDGSWAKIVGHTIQVWLAPKQTLSNALVTL
jgi:hypothetical protein